jgi:hypothetical protein
MIFKTSRRSLATPLLLTASLFVSGASFAVQMRTVPVPIYQVGTGAQVVLGHTVVASTNYNRLLAGGTYIATCAAAEMLPATGQRFITSDGASGPRSLYVTIPAVHPARVNMPGFNAAALRGRRLDCTYNWTSRAVESQYTVGAGGVGFVIGGGEISDGSTQIFTMTVPSTTDPNDGGSCIP